MRPLRAGATGSVPSYVRNLLPGKNFKTIRRVGIYRDSGSCLFHAIATALTGKIQPKKAGYALRKKIAAKATPASWRNAWRAQNLRPPISLRKFKRKMFDICSWADMQIIPYIQYYFKNVNLMFFDDKKIYCGLKYFLKTKKKSIFLLWVDNAHFEPIVYRKTNKKRKAKWSGIFNTDEILLQRYYENTCGIAKKTFFESLLASFTS